MIVGSISTSSTRPGSWTQPWMTWTSTALRHSTYDRRSGYKSGSLWSYTGRTTPWSCTGRRPQKKKDRPQSGRSPSRVSAPHWPTSIKRISAGNVWSRSCLGLCFRKTPFRGNKSLTTIVDSFSELDLIDNPLCNKEVDQRSENRVVYETGAELLVCEVVVGLNPFVHHVHPLPGLGAISRLYQHQEGTHKEETAA